MILGAKLGEAGPVMHCPESGEDPGGVGMTAPSEHALRECCLGALGCVLAVTRGRHPKRAQVLVDRSLEHHRKGLPASVCVCLCACVCMRACLPPPPLHTHRHTHTHTHTYTHASTSCHPVAKSQGSQTIHKATLHHSLFLYLFPFGS